MSQTKQQLTQNGQEVQQSDFNNVGNVSAHADDHVLKEFFRLAPFTSGSPTKLIVPYGHTGDTVTATVSPGTGAVVVSPFTAMVGSRDTYADIGSDNWNDSRSQAFVGSSALTQTVNINTLTTSGFGRWDLIYAQLSVDTNAPSVTRYVKDPATKVISPQTVITQINTVVSVQYLAGTAASVAAPPTLPAIPSDTPGVFNIPLAYVAVTAPFTSIVTPVSTSQIADQAPTPSFYRHLGVGHAVPASASNEAASAISPLSGWFTARPDAFMPPSMIGMTTIYYFLNTNTPSQATQTVIDDSRNWKNRAFLTFCGYSTNNTAKAAWTSGSTPANFSPQYSESLQPLVTNGNFLSGMGQSFIDDGISLPELGLHSGVVARFSPSNDGTHFVTLYVPFDTNKLSIAYTAGTVFTGFFIIQATPVFPNK